MVKDSQHKTLGCLQDQILTFTTKFAMGYVIWYLDRADFLWGTPDHPLPAVLKFLEEPAEVLSEGLHRLDTFLIVFHFSRVTPDPHVPIA